MTYVLCTAAICCTLVLLALVGVLWACVARLVDRDRRD
jgi:hypothetical protein